MNEQQLTDGRVARYCKPSSIDEQGSPTSAAFQRRPTEGYLSVFWLECFQHAHEKTRIHAVKQAMEQRRFTVKPRGQFAVLAIEQSTRYILDEVAEQIVYRTMNLPHCGIFHDGDDLLIAELLAECVQTSYEVKGLDE